MTRRKTSHPSAWRTPAADPFERPDDDLALFDVRPYDRRPDAEVIPAEVLELARQLVNVRRWARTVYGPRPSAEHRWAIEAGAAVLYGYAPPAYPGRASTGRSRLETIRQLLAGERGR